MGDKGFNEHYDDDHYIRWAMILSLIVLLTTAKPGAAIVTLVPGVTTETTAVIEEVIIDFTTEALA
jgi:hypothetical protein